MRLIAGAVQAAVFAARPTVLLQPLTQGPPSAVKANIQAVAGHGEVCSQLIRIDAIEIDPLDNFPVPFRQLRQEATETLANQAMVCGFGLLRQNRLHPLQGPSANVCPPVKIDDGSP